MNKTMNKTIAKPRLKVKSSATTLKITPKIFMNFVGSMNLAVTFLIMLAIASVIGTFLQQNLPFQDYILKFGPFWTEVFGVLGLFSVYGALWFVLVLIFLLISTGVCLTKNTPVFLKDMKSFGENLSINMYKYQPFSETISLEELDIKKASLILSNEGFKTRVKHKDDGVVIAGMKGGWNRLGYIFTHASIIIICVGALLDSNLLLKYRELTGDLVAEIRSIPLSEIPAESWLSKDNFSFRGSVSITEGNSTDVLFLPFEKGFLVQKLPFTLKVEAFRKFYYASGMPKGYETDLILTSPDLDEPIFQTIRVNEPLYFQDFAIFQSSYGDGGTILNLKVHPLLAPISNPLQLDTAINRVEPLRTPAGRFNIEFNDFRLYNIVPNTEEKELKTGNSHRNNGPSMIFKIRNEQGRAWEYENFLMPVPRDDGRYMFMSGIRAAVAEEFRYLFIPADENKSRQRFFEFLALINNPNETVQILQDASPRHDSVDLRTHELQIRLSSQLLVLFRQKGFDGISEFVELNVPKDEQEVVRTYYLEQVSIALQKLYLSMLNTNDNIIDYDKPITSITDFDKQWFEDAIVAISALSKYGPPLYFEIVSFQHIEATGLQITKSPGKNIVFFGATLLTIGIFFLLYIRQRRVWLAYSTKNKTLTIAGKDTKDMPETKKEFALLMDKIKYKISVK